MAEAFDFDNQTHAIVRDFSRKIAEHLDEYMMQQADLAAHGQPPMRALEIAALLAGSQALQSVDMAVTSLAAIMAARLRINDLSPDLKEMACESIMKGLAEKMRERMAAQRAEAQQTAGAGT